MPLEGLGFDHAPRIQRIRRASQLAQIGFVDGVAAVELPARLLDCIEFKNDVREDSPRLRSLENRIRSDGFSPSDPIICRIGARGRWIVIDGGHRLTAARRIMRSWWTNLFGPKVRNLYFILFETERSWRKVAGDRASAYHSPFDEIGADEPRSDAPAPNA